MDRKALSHKFILGTLTSIGVFLTIEAGVRALYRGELEAWSGPPPTPQQGAPTMRGSPYLLFEYAPGVRYEQGVTVTINSLGLRGNEIEVPKPIGVRRIMTTGDSSIFGFGVAESSVFSSVTTQKLGDEVEPIIAAIPGYSTFQTINLLSLRAMQSEPDLLVIGNLWSDNNFDSFVDKDLLATTIGYQHSLLGQLQRILSWSAIYRVADWKMRVRDQAERIRTVSWTVGSQEHIGPRRVEINDYAQNLESLVQIAYRADAEVVFLLPANEEDLTESSGPKAWTPYRTVMRDTAARHGAPLLEVPQLFRASGLGKAELFLDEMHPTATGHKIIGEALAELLSDWTAGDAIQAQGTREAIPHYPDQFVQSAAPNNENGQTTAAHNPHRIQGNIIYNDLDGGRIYLEAITIDSDPQILRSLTLNGAGPFVLMIGQPVKLTLRATIDRNGDGRDPSDTIFNFDETIFHLDQGPTGNVLLDLQHGSLSVQ